VGQTGGGCKIARAITADVPFAWAATDSVHGVGGLERVLRCAGC
jgi:hypothetical protein